MRRRPWVCAGMAAALAPVPFGRAQGAQVKRLGWLGVLPMNQPESAWLWQPFKAELERRGWVEGQNIEFVHRSANTDDSRFPALARELVAGDVDLICVNSGYAALAAKEATSHIPVVFMTAPDPVDQGVVRSLAHPGGNLTGLTSISSELIGKRMELLKEAFPRLVRVAVLPFIYATKRENEATQRVARRLGLQLLPADVRQTQDIAAALTAATSADAWFVQDDLIYIRALPGGAALDGPAAQAGDLRTDLLGTGRRVDGLCDRLGGSLPACCGPCRSHPARCEAGRPARRAAHALRTQLQSADRARDGHRDSQVDACACRRGDRMKRRALVLGGAATALTGAPRPSSGRRARASSGSAG